jgi:predicted Zn-ribbon and HTH transcriptional regulator
MSGRNTTHYYFLLLVEPNYNKEINYMAIIPFITSENYCMHCKSENTLVYHDLHGKEYNQLLYPIQYAQCKKCGHIYFMRWVPTENGEVIPFYDEEDTIDKFSKEIIDYAKTHRRILT